MRSLAAAVLASTVLVASCMSSGGSTRSGRVGPRPTGVPPAGVIWRGPCFLAKPVVAALKHSKLEKAWKELEVPNEAPLRKIIEQDTLAKEALASLEQSVLTPHKWTFT